ncbi:MAG: DNA-binding protein [Chloracidobacterium sp.]|nr:DNA-binding protein [Chloracidobacterium sp.]
MTNTEIAAHLIEVAHLLDERGANQFRIQAYHRAAETLKNLQRPVDELIKAGGLEALQELPGIGYGLASSIHQLVLTGRLSALERLRGESDPIATLASVTGIGARLAERLHSALGITTLEELESAAHDGRLAKVGGFGKKRITGIKESLATRLGRRRQPAPESSKTPPVSELLDVDREYRQKAEAGSLRKIAPKRFNPTGKAWLPVLHTKRGKRRYTALFSNTALAHELGNTHDWVVLYYDSGDGEGQCTVVTEKKGPLASNRVVRGRENESAAFYDVQQGGALALHDIGARRDPR